MKCAFFDFRAGFGSILAEKLGNDFLIVSTSPAQPVRDCDVIMVSIPPTGHGLLETQLSVLASAASNPAGVPVVALLAAPDHDLGLRVSAEGAYDSFVETRSLEELRIVLRRAHQFHELAREVERLREIAGDSAGLANVLTSNPKMKALCKLLAKVAASSATVLLAGQSGTGKGLLASAIHKASPRASRPFVALSCASLPEHLIEAELFGHEKGAFTGAVGARRGRFEAAGTGTIFLDEIGDLPPSMQVKLLRVLQERTFERLGSNEPRSMEARVICATHRPLKKLIKEGTFRADLYYRISTVEVEVPSLQERRGDILLLAHALLRKYAAQHSRPVLRFSPGVMAALQEHPWPGNVRELQNVVERAVVVCEGPEIHIGDLPPEFTDTAIEAAPKSFEDEVRDFKRRLVERALAQTGHCKVEAARQLGIARSSLFRLIEELHVSAPQSPSAENAESSDLGELSSNFGAA